MIIKEDCSLPREIIIQSSTYKDNPYDIGRTKLEHISDFGGFGIYRGKDYLYYYSTIPPYAIVCCDKNRFPYIIELSGYWTPTEICEIISRYNRCGKFNIRVNKYFNSYDNTYYYSDAKLGQYVI